MIYLFLAVIFLGCLYLYLIKYHKRENKSVCSLCLQTFNDKELTNIEELAFCKKDLKTYNNSKWEELKSVVSSADNPEQSVEIYENQKTLIDESIPAFIRSTYFEENLEIKTVFKLYVPEESLKTAKKLIFTSF